MVLANTQSAADLQGSFHERNDTPIKEVLIGNVVKTGSKTNQFACVESGHVERIQANGFGHFQGFEPSIGEKAIVDQRVNRFPSNAINSLEDFELVG